mmetsp:Transcript_9145/g.30310  ORF Transcript_9145/g.30310 Transcript_9145/m.30310 type:complete len:220 (-) Transcript_9145:447-1106(-)
MPRPAVEADPSRAHPHRAAAALPLPPEPPRSARHPQTRPGAAQCTQVRHGTAGCLLRRAAPLLHIERLHARRGQPCGVDPGWLAGRIPRIHSVHLCLGRVDGLAAAALAGRGHLSVPRTCLAREDNGLSLQAGLLWRHRRRLGPSVRLDSHAGTRHHHQLVRGCGHGGFSHRGADSDHPGPRANDRDGPPGVLGGAAPRGGAPVQHGGLPPDQRHPDAF